MFLNSRLGLLFYFYNIWWGTMAILASDYCITCAIHVVISHWFIIIYRYFLHFDTLFVEYLNNVHCILLSYLDQQMNKIWTILLYCANYLIFLKRQCIYSFLNIPLLQFWTGFKIVECAVSLALNTNIRIRSPLHRRILGHFDSRNLWYCCCWNIHLKRKKVILNLNYTLFLFDIHVYVCM